MNVVGNVILWAKTNKYATIPEKRSEDAGYDIYGAIGPKDYILIYPGETVTIPSGLKFAVSPDYYLQLEERGSTGTKGLKVSAGIIDSGYRGEIMIPIANVSNSAWIICTKETYDMLLKCAEAVPVYFPSEDDGNYVTSKGYSMYIEYFGTNVPAKFTEFLDSGYCTAHYDSSKAIAQGIIHRNEVCISYEVTEEEIMRYGSERGEGKLGSTGK